MLFDVQAALSEILAARHATPATPATEPNEKPPVSRMSRVSQQGSPEKQMPRAAQDISPRAAIAYALRRGAKTPGAVASAARLGGTETYEVLDRMTAEGFVTLGHNGQLFLAADREEIPEPPLPARG